MPILPAEPQLFPADLLAAPVPPGRWMVLHTFSRQEKRLARHLRQRGVPHYVPQREQRVRRTTISHLPLFPGYVFVAGGRREQRLARESNLIVRTLQVADQAELDRELRALWNLQQAGVPLVPHPYIDRGDLVEIAAGAFRGYRGIVTDLRGTYRLVITIASLRQSVVAEMEREAVRRVARPRGTGPASTIP